MPFMVPLLVGSAATGSAGLIGAGGAVTAGGALTAAGAAAGGYAAISGAQSASAQGKQQKALSEYNAQVQKQDAKAKQLEGLDKSHLMRERTRRLLADQQSVYGKAGVDTTSGSPLYVQMKTAELGEIDALMAGHNAQIGANRSYQQSRFDVQMGKSARRMGRMAAGQSLFSGAGTAAGLYARHYGA